MKFQFSLARIDKLCQAIKSARLARALVRYRVLASGEHRQVLTKDLATVIDIGANRGQFALAVRQWAPKARIIAFEPLPRPAAIFGRVFAEDSAVVLYEAAIGFQAERRTMHVSARDDSSSLLPISLLQTMMFPGTAEIDAVQVRVAPLNEFVTITDVIAPAMLKLDVQGFEHEALRGCESLLARFDVIYCECSFVELYSGQKLARDVIAWLSERGFALSGIYNPAYDRNGRAIQADFLFCRDKTEEFC